MVVEAPIASMITMPTSETSVSGENGGYPFTNLTSLEINPSMTENLVGGRQISAASLQSFEVFNPRSVDAGDRFVSPLSFQDILRSPEVNPLEDEQQIQRDTLLQTDLSELHSPQTPKSEALSQMIGTYMYLYMRPVDRQTKPLQTEPNSNHQAEEKEQPIAPVLSQETMYHSAISDMEVAVKIRDLSIELGADEETATQNTLSIIDLVFQERHFDPHILQEEPAIEQVAIVEESATPENISSPETAETILFDVIESRENGRKDEEEPDEDEKLYFVEDTGVNAIRERITASIANDLFDMEQTIFGSNIAEELPNDPQPEEVKSSVITGGNDGSYTSFIQSLAEVGELQTVEEINTRIDKAVADNTAVSLSDKKQNEVTEQEVNKVFNNQLDKSVPVFA